MSKSLENQSRRAFLGQSAAVLAGAAFMPSLFSCGGKIQLLLPQNLHLLQEQLIPNLGAFRSEQLPIAGDQCLEDWRILSSIANSRISVQSN